MKEQIITLPDSRLRKKAAKVRDLTDDIKDVISRMREASLDWEKDHPHEISAAMAAPQLGELYRIVILRDNTDDKDDTNFIALINPEIVKLEGEIEEDYEGCLSVPRIYGVVPRHTKVRLKAVNENGDMIRLKVDGAFARTIQHEIDHLNGILFVDRIKDRRDAFFELSKKGKLQPLDFNTIRDDSALW